MIKTVTHANLGRNLFHSQPSDIPNSPNQFLALDFFAASYSKTALIFMKDIIRNFLIQTFKQFFTELWSVGTGKYTRYIAMKLL